jgi:PAS domain S-box-containing protein
MRWLLAQFIEDTVPFAPLFIPIALSAFYGGMGPGLVSVLTTIVAADYFLLPPVYTLGLPDMKQVTYTALFSISGLVVSFLGELGRNAVLRASHEAEIRKVAQNQAHTAEERLGIAEQVVGGGVWEWDIPSNETYWSDGYRRLNDYPMDQKPSFDMWLKSLLPEDRERMDVLLDEAFRRKHHHWLAEYRIRTESGRMRWISSHGRIFYDAAGTPKRMVGINLDVTARHLVNEAARAKEAKLHLLMQSTHVGDWEWNPRDASFKCSPEFCEVLGLDPSARPAFDDFLACFHPEDRERVQQQLVRVQDDHGLDFEFESRVVAADGRERIVHTRGASIRDDIDGSVRVVGIVIDLARSDNEMLAS